MYASLGLNELWHIPLPGFRIKLVPEPMLIKSSCTFDMMDKNRVGIGTNLPVQQVSHSLIKYVMAACRFKLSQRVWQGVCVSDGVFTAR